MTDILPDADPYVVELLRNHPTIKAHPELLANTVVGYYNPEKAPKQPPKIPEFMVTKKRWTVFRKTWNDERKKFEKAVCNPYGGKPLAGFPDPRYDSDFGYFAEVKKRCDADPSLVPAFYILGEDGLLFADFDQPCAIPQYPTYTERSISGGYHVFGWHRGEKPNLPDTREVYQDRRWVIVTGDIVAGKSNINDITDYLAEMGYTINRSAYAGKKYPGSSFTVPEKIPGGNRNNVLFKFAASMRAKGSSEPAILAALLAENQVRCSPPLEESEVRSIAASAGKYPPGDLEQGKPKKRDVPLKRLLTPEQLSHLNCDGNILIDDHQITITLDTNRWQCSTHGTYGGLFELGAILTGLCNCEDFKKGEKNPLSGKRFEAAIKAVIDLGVSPDEVRAHLGIAKRGTA